MGFKFSQMEMESIFEALSKDYELLGPVVKPNGGRFSDQDIIGYGPLSKLDGLVFDEKSYYSPKEVVFPIRQTLFYFREGKAVEPELPTKPVLLFLRACDIEGIKRLDTIFLENGKEKDPYYAKLRERVSFVWMECEKSFENCFCLSMNTHLTEDHAFSLKPSEGGYVISIKDQGFKNYMTGGAEIEYIPTGVTQNEINITIPDLSYMGTAIFDDPLWTEYTRRCIACGRCNTSCVTCSCFTTQDITYSDGRVGERRRRWAGCHVDGFSDMAGGHSFRLKNGERMRFKTLHKISDFKKRFGVHMCVGCGRCTDVCPEMISFSTAIEKVNQAAKEALEL